MRPEVAAQRVADGDRDQDEPDAVGVSDLHFWFVLVLHAGRRASGVRPVRRPRQRTGVAVSRPMLVTVSVWPAGTTAEYSAVQQEGQQYWRNTMGAST
jgi:hypothetical protein